LSFFGTVSDSGNGVIEVVTAFSGVEDTTGITLEIVVGSINRDASWSRLNCGFSGRNALGFDGFVRNSVNKSLTGFGFTFLGFSNVWIC
jgi:hypothetical protein